MLVSVHLSDTVLSTFLQDNPMRLGICSRSKDVIEPMLKPQWYVKCDEMAKDACEAVRTGELEIIPPIFKDVWFR
jgi:valyl-tRNA synthetase